ncbi:unnamed protein product [Coffea canephora]|uniref:Uncharacterized protein n=1 Tax=Coffea canephora TaxID=49390 RepID=A0A068V777_COFCA|nr:unnamed protein product [Coffea canephora]
MRIKETSPSPLFFFPFLFFSFISLFFFFLSSSFSSSSPPARPSFLPTIIAAAGSGATIGPPLATDRKNSPNYTSSLNFSCRIHFRT